LIIRETEFDFDNETYIMGILNVTPDSFSDGGEHFSYNEAANHAKKMIDEGVHIIDIGGESTRPGFEPVGAEEEIERVVPVIKEIRKFTSIPISVDTTKATVARAAIEAGADIINDVSGFLKDKEMGKFAAESGVPSILMHDSFYFNDDILNKENRNLSYIIEEATSKEKYLREVMAELKVLADGARLLGVKKENIILDPGIGFGKTLKQNLILLDSLKEMNEVGYPLLLGCSRKSVIGKSLDLPANERVEGTITTSVLAAQAGVSIIRVHDVKENLRAVKMLKAIRRGSANV